MDATALVLLLGRQSCRQIFTVLAWYAPAPLIPAPLNPARLLHNERAAAREPGISRGRLHKAA